jgi:hypothetical protein
MSFLYRTQPALRTLVLARSSSASASRLFTTTAIQNKSATEAVKDTVKSVDRKVSDAAVSGIEKGGKSKVSLLMHFAFKMMVPPHPELKKNYIPPLLPDLVTSSITAIHH